MIRGRVQGVFFRRSARAKAREFGLLGWVRNAEDGNVEILAEGEPEKIDEFLKWCREGPPFAKVDNVTVEDQEQKEEKFTDFEVR